MDARPRPVRTPLGPRPHRRRPPPASIVLMYSDYAAVLTGLDPARAIARSWACVRANLGLSAADRLHRVPHRAALVGTLLTPLATDGGWLQATPLFVICVVVMGVVTFVADVVMIVTPTCTRSRREGFCVPAEVPDEAARRLRRRRRSRRASAGWPCRSGTLFGLDVRPSRAFVWLGAAGPATRRSSRSEELPHCHGGRSKRRRDRSA